MGTPALKKLYTYDRKESHWRYHSFSPGQFFVDFSLVTYSSFATTANETLDNLRQTVLAIRLTTFYHPFLKQLRKVSLYLLDTSRLRVVWDIRSLSLLHTPAYHKFNCIKHVQSYGNCINFILVVVFNGWPWEAEKMWKSLPVNFGNDFLGQWVRKIFFF